MWSGWRIQVFHPVRQAVEDMTAIDTVVCGYCRVPPAPKGNALRQGHASCYGSIPEGVGCAQCRRRRIMLIGALVEALAATPQVKVNTSVSQAPEDV